MFGKEEHSQDTQPTGLKVGINEGAKLIFLGIKHIDHGDGWDQAEWHFAFGEKNDEGEYPVVIKTSRSIIQPSTGQYAPKGDPVKALASKIQGFNVLIQNIMTNYMERDEYYDLFTELPSYTPEEMYALTNEEREKVFINFVNICAQALPEGFEEREGELILMNDKNGWKKTPVSSKVTGPFFSIDGRHELNPSKIVKDSAKNQRPDRDSNRESSSEEEPDIDDV